jgi:uncharacterized membrane protein
MKFKNHLLILLLSILFSACLTNVEEQIEEEDPTIVDPCEAITFSLSVKPIIDNNCIQCHGAGGNFPNLTTYNGISSNASIVKSETVSRRMPQGGSLTNEEIKAISCWVDGGALNN